MERFDKECFGDDRVDDDWGVDIESLRSSLGVGNVTKGSVFPCVAQKEENGSCAVGADCDDLATGSVYGRESCV